MGNIRSFAGAKMNFSGKIWESCWVGERPCLIAQKRTTVFARYILCYYSELTFE